MKKKQYAFWRYDLFPYFLGGEITEITSTGLVETKEFGKGNWFKPCLIVNKAEGEEINMKLKQLKTEFLLKKSHLYDEYLTKVGEVSPLIKKKMKD